MSNAEDAVTESPPPAETRLASHPPTEPPEPEKRRREYKGVTLTVAILALLISSGTFYFLFAHTVPLQDKQRHQIERLEASTPAGTIIFPTDKTILRKSDPNPHVTGTAQHVADDGNLWIVLHLYVDMANGTPDRYYITPVNPKHGSSRDIVQWVASDKVTIGSGKDIKSKTYRLTLYYCGSHDSQQMNKVVLDQSLRRQGLESLGSSCKQLDGHYITRLAH